MANKSVQLSPEKEKTNQPREEKEEEEEEEEKIKHCY